MRNIITKELSESESEKSSTCGQIQVYSIVLIFGEKYYFGNGELNCLQYFYSFTNFRGGWGFCHIHYISFHGGLSRTQKLLGDIYTSPKTNIIKFLMLIKQMLNIVREGSVKPSRFHLDSHKKCVFHLLLDFFTLPLKECKKDKQ